MRTQISRKRYFGISVFLLLSTLAVSAWGKVIYVDDDANGLNDGSSWVNAYRFLQDALADANSGEKLVEIRVAQGIYRPDRSSAEPNGTGDREATFRLIDGISLKGGYAGIGASDPNTRDIAKYETILSGDLARNDMEVNDPCDFRDEPSRAENSLHVVMGIETDETAVLDGFTITAGSAFSKPWNHMVTNPDNYGGGLHNKLGSPTLIKCTFKNNSAEENGGGMYSKGPVVGDGPTLVNCTFERNAAKGCGEVGDRTVTWDCVGAGGGLASMGGNPVLEGCTFINNWAQNFGGGMTIYGEHTVTGCVFKENRTLWGGGAMTISSGGNSVISECVFRGNSAVEGAGGGINMGDSSPVVSRCVFAGNTAENGGGVASEGRGTWSFIDCTFSGNSGDSGGAIFGRLTNLRLTRCFVIGNAADIGGGIYCGHLCDVNLSNCTFAGNLAVNARAIACDSYAAQWPGKYEISNCIFWDTGQGIWNNDGSEVKLRFNDIRGGQEAVYAPLGGVVWGQGNISLDPLFANPNNGGYHLKSQGGRWDPNTQTWVKDDVTSPCIDAGEPMSPIGEEQFPNGGRINMGAYGGTEEASKSYFGTSPCETIIAGDINGDCIVNFVDLMLMALHWLEEG